MWALVKNLKTKKLETVDINYIISYIPGRPEKKFKIKLHGEEFDGLVVVTRDTREELQEYVTNTRVKVPPPMLLSSADDDILEPKSKPEKIVPNAEEILKSKLAAKKKSRL